MYGTYRLLIGLYIFYWSELILSIDNENSIQDIGILTPEDFLASEDKDFQQKLLSNFSTGQNQTLNPNKFEGDISLPANQSIHAFINDSNDVNRAAVRDQWRKWPNNEIPYVISNMYGAYSKQILARAFDEYHQKTCIRFVPREESKHKDYIYIYPEDGCYSYVGRTNGKQVVSLDAGCMQFGTVLHELMHSVGFFHEQSRADRDDWVEVVWANVRSDADTQFEKYSLRTITQLDLPYDYSSVMHYGPRTFSKNGRDTLRPLKDGSSLMGQRRGFSYLDLKKLNKLYECDQISVTPDSGVDTDVINGLSSGSSTSWGGSRGGSSDVKKCDNKKWNCFFWKLLQYCWRDKPWMVQYCPWSCDYCDEVVTPPVTNSNANLSKNIFTNEDAGNSPKTVVSTNQVTSKDNCTDLHSHCGAWLKLGYCSSGLRKDFQAFMNRNCPKSCGQCPKGPSADQNQPIGDQLANCQDDLEVCKSYAYWGFCKAGNNKRQFMLEKCKQSCNFCKQ